MRLVGISGIVSVGQIRDCAVFARCVRVESCVRTILVLLCDLRTPKRLHRSYKRRRPPGLTSNRILRPGRHYKACHPSANTSRHNRVSADAESDELDEHPFGEIIYARPIFETR